MERIWIGSGTGGWWVVDLSQGRAQADAFLLFSFQMDLGRVLLGFQLLVCVVCVV